MSIAARVAAIASSMTTIKNSLVSNESISRVQRENHVPVICDMSGSPNVSHIYCGSHGFVSCFGASGAVLSEYYAKPEAKHITLETNCKNCGAPLKSSKCEYCGTIHQGGVNL